MGSTDGGCRYWDKIDYSGDKHGAVSIDPSASSEDMEASTLYWLTDRTPHQSIPATVTAERQFVRVVSDNVDGWWEEHSTPNPLGIKPNCKILAGSKF
jgi:hypothetical protein